MKPETSMWNSIRPVLKPLDPVRIESRETGSGIPDVNYTQGWIELKYVERWPPRNGPLRVDHFTQDQRNWLRQRWLCGGRAFLLLKIGKSEWLLFYGPVAAKFLGTSTREELYKLSVARWSRLPKFEEIKTWLIK